jgi:thiol-disulfide isomerase/thioredoxin
MVRWLPASVLIAATACDRGLPPPPPSSPPQTAAAPSPSPSAVAAPAPVQTIAKQARSIDPPAVQGASPNLVAVAGAMLATWLEPADDARAAYRLRFSKFVDGTWSTPSTIAEGASIIANWADVPSAVAQVDGTLVAHWAEKARSPDAHAYDVVLARSVDGGTTWSRLGTPHRDGAAAEHGFVSLLADGDGVLAVWLDGRAMVNGGRGPMMLRAARVNQNIGPEQVIDDRVCDCCSTSAAMTTVGPAVVYRDRDGGELRDPWLVRRTASGWSAPTAVHRDRWTIAGCPVNGPAVVARGREVVVAWYTYESQRATVRVAFSSDDGATFASPIEVDGPAGARTPIGRVDLVIERPGEVIVSWTASARDQGQLLVRRVTRDGRRGAEVVITAIAAGREAGFPKMESLGEDLVLLWTDTATRNVRAVRLPRHDVPAITRDAPVAAPQQQARFAIGTRAPDYEASLLDGSAITLAALRGHPVLLNVWATWCEPCRRELPVLSVVQARHRDRRLRVVALSVDREASPDRVATFARRLAPGLEVWHDPRDRVSSLLGVSTMPTTMLFDADGILRWRREGSIVDGDPELERALASIDTLVQ